MQACIVRPCEEGQFEVFSTTQWMHIVQSLIAGALKISKNKVDLKVWSAPIIGFQYSQTLANNRLWIATTYP